MFDQFTRLDEEHLLFLAAMAVLASVLTTVLTAVVALQVRRFRERQLELGFKNDLLRRGLSVDEAVRLATSRRPTRAQSIMAVGDWTLSKLSHARQRATDALPRLLRPCRRLLRTAWRSGRQVCRGFWRESRPLLRQAMKSISRGVHWLGGQTDRLARRLAPHRP